MLRFSELPNSFLLGSEVFTFSRKTCCGPRRSDFKMKWYLDSLLQKTQVMTLLKLFCAKHLRHPQPCLRQEGRGHIQHYISNVEN